MVNLSMTSELLLTLQITLIGMGLVFGAIVLLWVVIAILMRFTAERKSPVDHLQDESSYSYVVIEEREQKRRAALAAVAVALAIYKQAPHEFPLPPTALVSAWQAVMRASNVRNRGSVR
jgi:Na+-transporting methylmalonyl-CoA/oxaloacetate decarboxylase gamma subunit